MSVEVHLCSGVQEGLTENCSFIVPKTWRIARAVPGQTPQAHHRSPEPWLCCGLGLRLGKGAAALEPPEEQSREGRSCRMHTGVGAAPGGAQPSWERPGSSRAVSSALVGTEHSPTTECPATQICPLSSCRLWCWLEFC